MKKQFIIAVLLAVTSTSWAQAPAAAKPGAPAGKPIAGAPAAPSAVMDEMSMVKEQIARIDTNKDGKISLVEFLAQPTEAFKKMDANGDGFLTAEELISAHKKQMDDMRAKMAAQGIGGPGGPGPHSGMGPGPGGPGPRPMPAPAPAPAK